MDPFAAIIGGLVLIMVIGLVALGLWYPGSGAEVLDWKSPRAQAESEAALESDDLAQLLEGVNARRRARGERELTVRELRSGQWRQDG